MKTLEVIENGKRKDHREVVVINFGICEILRQKYPILELLHSLTYSYTITINNTNAFVCIKHVNNLAGRATIYRYE